MKLSFKVIQGYDDIKLGKYVKEGTILEFDHLEKRPWELVKAGVVEQIERNIFDTKK